MNKLFGLIIVIIILSACSDSKGPVTFKDMGKQSVEITDSIVIYSSSKDITLWELQAVRLKKFPKDNVIYFSDIELKLMNKDGTLAATIFADSAVVNDDIEEVYAEGNIEIYSQEGDIFGESLTWERRNDKIFSDDSVKVIQQGNVIRGSSFTSDARFEHVTLHTASAEGEVDESKVLW
ncbi:MAG: LPS export ABC transporter periplasmic protein LptC [Candidatus Cloacimonetes bacterium]|nr:LPS export ABC transporter periplasmic protein LptC [Candidatus Cloacimonadota bacterium]